MTACEPADVVVVRFPFSNLESAKQRPALVVRPTTLGSRLHIVTLAMITSRVEGPRLQGDVLLEEWKSAKLLYPSLLRLSKMATVDARLIGKRIGRLSRADLERVGAAFQEFYRIWLAD